MEFFAYPYTLFNMSIEAVGVYVLDLMKRLITDLRYSRGPDGECRHYQCRAATWKCILIGMRRHSSPVTLLNS